MAVDQTGTDYLLPCGRSLDEVWDGLDAPDTHARGCPHCQTAAGGLRALRESTEQLAADIEEPSAGLTDRIMAAVCADLRRRDMVPLPTAEPGGVRVSEQAVAAVLRYAADEVPGVRARRCRLSVTGFDEDGNALVEAELTLAVSYLSYTHGVLETVRDRAYVACHSRVGLRLRRLDLVVGDLYEGP
ncbi:Asp23/Gls24 family envelope stress response protein [Fodinicola acaciae]|uniref:Asp23/Gls24 family envelope stress response protein n=1 Tax=Fodinicola acaciae TaxID=2681555 RepID=UPI0013D76641|nr:Asp23/Gls24 family envelope stress response protein [Fodinicola acaciae]